MAEVAEVQEKVWYSYDKICSYNAAFNFIVGLRGNGKSYGAKLLAIRKAIRKGEQFIYLRRYKPELTGRFEFFADIAHEFPEWDFRVLGAHAYMSPVEARLDKKRDWKKIGFFIALSQAQQYKSHPFPLVTTIIFDEFILEKSNLEYLRNEVKTMTNFYFTVDRKEDRVRVYFTANSASIINPYFIQYKIRPDEFDEYTVLNGGFVAVHLIDAEPYREDYAGSRFIKFIQETDPEYANYATEGTFSDAHLEMIAQRRSEAKYQYSLETRSGTFAVWYDALLTEYFIESKASKRPRTLTLVAANMGEGKTLIDRSNPVMGMLRTAFRHNRMNFDTPETRNLLIEVFNK